MCFSANASFTAGAIVAVAGVVSTKKVDTRTQIMFASIPIIFAVQQITEGFVWETLTHQQYMHLQNIPVTMFLIIAQVLWPVWVPLSIYLIEKEGKQKRALKILVWISIVVALLQAHRLFFFPYSAELTPHHIHYSLDFSVPYYALVLNVFYFITTMIPPFISKNKRIVALGLLNLTSFVTTLIFFQKDVVSLWCFFAALISWQVVLVMKEVTSKPQLESVPSN